MSWLNVCRSPSVADTSSTAISITHIDQRQTHIRHPIKAVLRDRRSRRGTCSRMGQTRGGSIGERHTCCRKWGALTENGNTGQRCSQAFRRSCCRNGSGDPHAIHSDQQSPWNNVNAFLGRPDWHPVDKSGTFRHASPHLASFSQTTRQTRLADNVT